MNKFCSLGLQTKRPRQTGEGRNGPKLRRPTHFVTNLPLRYTESYPVHMLLHCICTALQCNPHSSLFSHFVWQFNTKKSWVGSYFLYSLCFYLVLLIVKFKRNVAVISLIVTLRRTKHQHGKPSTLKQTPLRTQIDMMLEKKKNTVKDGKNEGDEEEGEVQNSWASPAPVRPILYDWACLGRQHVWAQIETKISNKINSNQYTSTNTTKQTK